MFTTRAALLTSEGRGAIAVIAVWGAGAMELVASLFRPFRARSTLQDASGRPRLGRMGREPGDEVVVVCDSGTESVEIQCHGGAMAIACVIDALVASGVCLVSSEEWIRHREPGSIESDALIDLAHATTQRTAQILLDQADGALREAVVDLRGLVRHGASADQSTVLPRLETLLVRGRVGLKLLSGWRVQIAGLPNAGKSRLLNSLLGFDRSIVHHEPGTTRDLVSQTTAFDGWPVTLIDSAGLREAEDSIEQAGVARAYRQIRNADLVLLVVDNSTPWLPEFDRLLQDSSDALRIASKSDLEPLWNAKPRGFLAVSAIRGAGMRELVEAIGHRLVPQPPPPGAAVPFRRNQVRLIRAASNLLSEGHRRRALDALELLIK